MKTTKRILAISAVILAAAIIWQLGAAGAGLAFATTFLAAAAIAVSPASLASGRLGAAPDTNDISSELQLNEILDAAIIAFKRAIMPITMFSTVFRNVQLKGSDKVSVPFYPIQGGTSKNFSSSYDFATGAGSNTESVDITVNKRKYQPLLLTSAELARYPALNAQRLGQLKGEKLAFDVIQDILSAVTLANFGAAAFTGSHSGFDSEDVIDLKIACDGNTVGGVACPWPQIGRGLLLTPTYDGALLKDNVFSQAYSIGTAQAIQEGRLPRVFGFDYAASAAIPGNSENLVGMAAYMSAIVAAFSPIAPAPAVARNLSRYEIVTDPATGISIEYREWGDADSDSEKRVLECNYGYAKGEATAIKRVVSA